MKLVLNKSINTPKRLNMPNEPEGVGIDHYPNVVMIGATSYPLLGFKFNKTKPAHIKVGFRAKNKTSTRQGTYNITDGNGSDELAEKLFAVKGEDRYAVWEEWLKSQKVGSTDKTLGDFDVDMNEFLDIYHIVERENVNVNDIKPEDDLAFAKEKNYEPALIRYLAEFELPKKSDVAKAEKKGALRGAKSAGSAVGKALGSQTLTNEELQQTQSLLDAMKQSLGTGAYDTLSKGLMKKYLDNKGRIKPNLTRQESDGLKQLIQTKSENVMNTMTDTELETSEGKQYYTKARPDQSNPRFNVSQERIDAFSNFIEDFHYENLIRDKEGIVIGYDKSYGQPLTPHTDPDIRVGILLSADEDTALMNFESNIREAHRVRDNLPPDWLIHKHIDEGAVEAKAPVKGQSIPTGADAGEQIAEDGEEAKNEIVGVQPHQNLGAGAGAPVQPNQPLQAPPGQIQPPMGAGYAGGVVGSAMSRAFRRRQANQFQQRDAEMDAEANRIGDLGIGATRTYENAPPQEAPAIQATTREGETPQTMIQQGVAEADEKANIDQGAIQDQYADVSMYGYDKQVSMFAKKQGRDFTYTKEMIRKSKDAPSKDPKIKKKQTKGILAEWGYTIQIKKLKTNDYEECLEVYTFVHLARDMYRLERKWKRALSKMNSQMATKSGNDLNQLIQDAQTGGGGNVGLVIQTPNAIPLGNFAGNLGAPNVAGGAGAGIAGGAGSRAYASVARSGGGGGSGSGSGSGSGGFTRFSNQSGSVRSDDILTGDEEFYEPPTGADDDAELTDRGSEPSSYEEGSYSGSDRRRLAGFNTDVNYSNTHQVRDARYSNVVATNAQGIVSTNRVPNRPQGVQTIRKPTALKTTYSHRPSQARGGHKAKTLRKHKPRLNVKEVQLRMKRHRMNSNLGFTNLLKQNPRQEGVMPPFRLRDNGKKLNRIKF